MFAPFQSTKEQRILRDHCLHLEQHCKPTSNQSSDHNDIVWIVEYTAYRPIHVAFLRSWSALCYSTSYLGTLGWSFCALLLLSSHLNVSKKPALACRAVHSYPQLPGRFKGPAECSSGLSDVCIYRRSILTAEYFLLQQQYRPIHPPPEPFSRWHCRRCS